MISSVALLKTFGILAETTIARGWRGLTNGELTDVASHGGFTTILTKDRMFGDSAAKALQRFPSFSAVVLNIPQSRSAIYLKEFEKAWKLHSIGPIPGQLVNLPKL